MQFSLNKTFDYEAKKYRSFTVITKHFYRRNPNFVLVTCRTPSQLVE